MNWYAATNFAEKFNLPTGQGTGLGLSLCYDIVKAHGGELKVETKIDEGCQFIIILLI